MRMPFDPEWDAKFKGFLKKAGDDFKKAALDVKTEAERLMKEAQDPKRQEKMREGLSEASVWAKKTADQLATLVDTGVKQAEGALNEVVKQFKTSAAATAADPTPPSAPPKMDAAPAPEPKPDATPAKKTIGKSPKPKAKKPKAAAEKPVKKTIGKKKKADE